jgi:hypothetical protein
MIGSGTLRYQIFDLFFAVGKRFGIRYNAKYVDVSDIHIALDIRDIRTSVT